MKLLKLTRDDVVMGSLRILEKYDYSATNITIENVDNQCFGSRLVQAFFESDVIVVDFGKLHVKILKSTSHLLDRDTVIDREKYDNAINQISKNEPIHRFKELVKVEKHIPIFR